MALNIANPLGMIGNGGGGMGGGIGVANAVAAQNAYPNPFAQFVQDQKTYAFSVEQIENGFIVHYGGKKFMSEDLDSAMDRVKACIVTQRLEK